MLSVGTSKIDITPEVGGQLDGMPRAQGSTGIHDPLYSRAMVISQTEDKKKTTAAIVSADVCVLNYDISDKIQKAASEKTGIPAENMIIAATHTHSGPAVYGFFNPKDEKYIEKIFIPNVVKSIVEANNNLQPAEAGWTSGIEDTVSHYRRLMSKKGKIIMNWEPFDPADIIGPTDEGDPEVGVLKFVSGDKSKHTIATLYNHAGHPNVMSGENFLVSADYPGLSSKVVEEKVGGIALFLNGAQGSVDIDGLKDRDWQGVNRAGNAIGEAVTDLANKIKTTKEVKFSVMQHKFTVPIRVLTSEELDWAKKITATATNEIVTLRDGVGDEWKANLLLEIHEKKGTTIPINMVGIAISNDVAFLSFPGELYTEIGRNIKKKSPFKYTYIIDLANGYVGYYPTKKAIKEGGYSEDTRRCDASSEEIIVNNSLNLLKNLKETI